MIQNQNIRSAPLLDYFPEIEPYDTGFLSVDAQHALYWSQSGNTKGVPVLFIHGGPGAGCPPQANRFFDPDHYRIITLDQRGSGHSKPSACLENNTTAHLIGDIEKLRHHLEIDQWHIFGGSWGSTLALSYAAQHPQQILSMVLRGIFLCEERDIHWTLYEMKNIFPEAWEQFVSIIPEARHNDILEAYYERFTSHDEDLKMEAAIHWSLYESACASLIPNYETVTTAAQRKHALNIAAIECHYFRNHIIPPQESLLTKIDAFRHIPAVIIQGRYDIICPIVSAHRLHNAWPEAEYIVVPDAGHSADEPPIRSELIKATEKMKVI